MANGPINKAPGDVSGAFGSAPVGAPYEVSKPLTNEARRDMARKARANEKTLEPLKYATAPIPERVTVRPPQPVAPPEPVAEVPETVDAATGEPVLTGAAYSAQEAEVASRVEVSPAIAQVEHAAKVLAIEAAPVLEPGRVEDKPQPQGAVHVVKAAHTGKEVGKVISYANVVETEPDLAGVVDPNDDPVTAQPLRGKPKPITDPGKTITGGFGEMLDAQYAPMQGDELAALARKLFQPARTTCAICTRKNATMATAITKCTSRAPS